MIDLSFYKDKWILVTGHTGFKGSWLCNILVKAGAHVIGYSLGIPTNPSLFELSKIESKISSYVDGDIRDYNHLYRVFDTHPIEIVFHLAAQPIVRESYRNPVYTYETNTLGTVNLLDCVKKFDTVKSVVNITTDKVYLNYEDGRYFIEDDRLDGYDPYSNSKSCSELVTKCFTRSYFTDGRCKVATVRAGNVIGGGDFAKDRILPDCVRALENNTNLIIRSPESIRPYQHVLDALAVYLAIAEKQYKDASTSQRSCASYNVGPDTSDYITTGALVEKFYSYFDNKPWFVSKDTELHEANLLLLDTSKIKSLFNWTPRWHINESIKKTAEWTKVYLEDKDKIPEEINREIEEFFRGE